MHMSFNRLALTLLVLFLWFSQAAGVSGSLNTFFNKAGVFSNTTNAGVYEGQAGGLSITGGSLYMRTPASNTTLVTTHAPRYRAGCSGADIHLGGVDFIEADELVSSFRNIGNGATSYIFMLALKSLTPMLGEVTEQMSEWAQQINKFNINSCEMAAKGVGALMGLETGEKSVCVMQALEDGTASSYDEAANMCTAKGMREPIMNNAAANPQLKDFVSRGNIAWKALKKVPFAASDNQMARALMSLTGTCIIKKVDNPHETDPANKPDSLKENHCAPSLGNEILEGLLFTKKFIAYDCTDGYGEEECLTLSNNTEVVLNETIMEKVGNMIASIITKINADEALSAQQVSFLESTSFPVYQMLNTIVTSNKLTASAAAQKYTEAIAIDLLFTYIESMLKEIRNGATSLAIADERKDRFISQVEDVKSMIYEKRRTFADKNEMKYTMIRETEMLRKTLISKFSTKAKESYAWSKSLR